jgi:hypothetical protein
MVRNIPKFSFTQTNSTEAHLKKAKTMLTEAKRQSEELCEEESKRMEFLTQQFTPALLVAPPSSRTHERPSVISTGSQCRRQSR